MSNPCKEYKVPNTIVVRNVINDPKLIKISWDFLFREILLQDLQLLAEKRGRNNRPHGDPRFTSFNNFT